MKTRFNTFDIVCAVAELQSLVGMRVNQVYDIDNKTFLIRFQEGEKKFVLLLESGVRFHTTAFEWPKNMAPSGFSMKLRKHLKNKRLEKLNQLEMDRIVDFQFGSGEAAYHVIIELYDRGNIILTDYALTILNILRPHYEGESTHFAVREKYPTNRAKQRIGMCEEGKLKELLLSSPPKTHLRRVLMNVIESGPAVIDHVLSKYNLDSCILQNESIKCEDDENSVKNRKNKKHEDKVRFFNMDNDFNNLLLAIQEADKIIREAQNTTSKGFIIQNEEFKPATKNGEPEILFHYIEYHPYLFCQFGNKSHKTFDTFMLAVDEFYSKLEEQRIDLKTLQQERDAIKKLTNVKEDHAKRLEELNKAQEGDKRKAELITMNQELVDNAIKIIRSALANQMSWTNIHELVKAAQRNSDPIANSIKQLKLEVNHVSLMLSDPYDLNEENIPITYIVDVDLSLSAWANARKYYDQKRTAAKKEQKTLDSSQKALKSAEKKTQQTLKDVQTISKIVKARKVYWFEKFYWFISSENFLVIGGRDAQQNELIVKRYMRPCDIYVHAEIQGASSVVIRNPFDKPVPPKTLEEAGTMAISYSVAWDAKVVTTAYWVRSDQVSKTAPTGEYLGTGSFMVRGKKNFLPSCHLIMGLSLLFKLEESYVEGHKGERKIRNFEDESLSNDDKLFKENEELYVVTEEVEDTEVTDNANINNSSNNTIDFPDTQVKIEHGTGKITIRSDLTSNAKRNEDNSSIAELDEATIIAAMPMRSKTQKNNKKRKEEKKESKINSLKEKPLDIDNLFNSQMKRGQKGKYKKMKIKYRDQDEEERQLRMQILKSSGKENSTGEKGIVDGSENKPDPLNTNTVKYDKKENEFKEKRYQTDIDDGDDTSPLVDGDLLDSLTGQPLDGDELLFLIPVVAPYQALQNYKYKVKLTPGTGKRGRAAKTALSIFSSDKNCSLREKDLLKSVKEEALARNIPGKVKVSAPQLQKYKK